MFRTLLFICILAVSNFGFAKTIVDLMKEGRFREAKQIIDTTAADTRYSLLWYAMQESDGVRACSLYQIISVRYPGTDADSLSKERLQQAMNMGMKVKSFTAAETPAEPIQADTQIVKAEPQIEVKELEANKPTQVDTIVALSALPFDPVEKDTPVQKEQMIATEEVKQQAEITKPAPLAVKEEKSEPAPKPQAEPLEKKIEPVEQVKAIAPPASPKVEIEKPKEIEKAKSATLPTTHKVEVEKPKKVEAVKIKPVATPENNSATTNEHWYIQVGAFGNHDNANHLADKLRNAGYKVVLIPRELPDKTLLQVRVGGYAARENCDSVVSELKEKFQLPAVVIHD